MRSAPTCKRLLVLIVFWAFCGAVPSAGCSYSCSPIKVARRFTVRVLDYRERPFGNVELVLMKDDGEVGRFKTGNDGKVVISKLAPGDYELEPADKIRGWFPCVGLLTVSDGPSSVREITLHWPTGYFIQTRVLAGRLRAGRLPEGVDSLQKMQHEDRLHKGTFSQEEVTPVAETEVELFRLPSRELVAKTKTDGLGHFDFPVLEQGLYFIRLKWSTYDESILLDLDPDLASSVPDLDIVIGNLAICGDAPGYYSVNGRE